MSIDIPVEDSIHLRADLQLTLVETRRARLELGPDVDGPAKAISKEGGFDEAKLRREWLNMVLDDLDAYAAAVDDPDAHYLEWLKDRVANPFRVPVQLFEAAYRIMGGDAVNYAEVVWDQEIAWAHRLRRSDDGQTVILCEMFLKACRRDIKREFLNLGRVLATAKDDFEYVTAPEHSYAPEQIRFGYGSSRFRPLFLRYAEVEFAEPLVKAMEVDAGVLVSKIQAIEEAAMQSRARDRAVEAMSRARMTRMGSVIRTAIDLGIDSDYLDAAYEAFLVSVRKGEIPLPVNGGLPHSKFLSWLRTRKFSEPVEPPEGFDNGGSHVLKEIVERSRSWLEALPGEYKELGSGKAEMFHEWLLPMTANRRPTPNDMVLDYGFFLMRKMRDERPGRTTR